MTNQPIPPDEIPEVQTHTSWSTATTVVLDGQIVEVVQAVRLLLWARSKQGAEIGSLRAQLDALKTEIANIQAGEPAGYVSEELIRHALSKVSVVPSVTDPTGYQLVTAVKLANGEVREVRVDVA